ncbi:hypothetical protein NE237_000118 [Protea cynaroides]|uniref:Flavin-containing monooxygenase n=1 Tax=Protea cynaroides TaxID=273540 RepID=A0A9Q0GQ84_9MAGN|nr:hypothetical protein NE237_000118 [Protea cynaroides]
METVVIIVGAGPAGLATSACLNVLSISNIVFEKDDCSGSLWKKKSYDRLKLHLAKEYCELPHFPYPIDTPTYISKDQFIKYMDDYEVHLNINPWYHQSIESAWYDEIIGKWHVNAKNLVSNEMEEYVSEFLVVATGENAKGFIPNITGLHSYEGEIAHSSEYKNGGPFSDKDVLVVGCGNSGMEIAYDLANYGAKTSIVIENPVHVLTKEMVHLGMFLQRFLPLYLVDGLVTMLAKLRYGDLSKYGIVSPKNGPFYIKHTTNRSPVIDVGTIQAIKNGDIQVLPKILSIDKRKVIFKGGKIYNFDAIIFATGYRSTAKDWLKDDDLLNDDGMPRKPFPGHWKGTNGLYCVGFSRRALPGISKDAQNIAKDIEMTLKLNLKTKGACG